MSIPPSLLAPFLHVLYRLWCSTLHITEIGRERLESLVQADKLAVVSIWHDELFALIHVRRNLRLVTVVSQSRDGEHLARLLQSLRIKTARGSSHRGGLAALLQAARMMREERRHCVVTVDGPKGPRHKAKQGAIILALRAPAYILPMRILPERAKIFRSWDRFQLPLPFSRVTIVFGEPYLVSAKELTEDILEKEQLKLEERLESLAPSGNMEHGRRQS